MFVYDFDWYPGVPNDPDSGIVGVIGSEITTDSFSFTALIQSVDPEGNPTGEAMVFDPGIYSVVFYVGPAGSAPEYFAEIRATVDGDITVTAPAWGSWQQRGIGWRGEVAVLRKQALIIVSGVR